MIFQFSFENCLEVSGAWMVKPTFDDENTNRMEVLLILFIDVISQKDL